MNVPHNIYSQKSSWPHLKDFKAWIFAGNGLTTSNAFSGRLNCRLYPALALPHRVAVYMINFDTSRFVCPWSYCLSKNLCGRVRCWRRHTWSLERGYVCYLSTHSFVSRVCWQFLAGACLHSGFTNSDSNVLPQYCTGQRSIWASRGRSRNQRHYVSISMPASVRILIGSGLEALWQWHD